MNRFLLRWFTQYCRIYLKRHFRAVYLAGRAPAFEQDPQPTVVYLNHPAWWDPLVCLLVSNRFTANLQNFAPIDAQSLARFGFFAKLGFFGVEKGTRRVALRFFQTATAILENHRAVLWVTPQGDFVDARVRPTRIKAGIVELAARVPDIRFVPLAVEYFFSKERLPFAALRFGDVVPNTGHRELKGVLERALEQAQDELASEVISNQIYSAETLLSGTGGTAGVYGWWERLRGTRC